MPQPTQSTLADIGWQLNDVVLSLQRLRAANGGGDGDGDGGGGLSTQSNGCSTYSIQCGTRLEEAAAPR